jgi:hypothetical protein
LPKTSLGETLVFRGVFVEVPQPGLIGRPGIELAAQRFEAGECALLFGPDQPPLVAASGARIFASRSATRAYFADSMALPPRWAILHECGASTY